MLGGTLLTVGLSQLVIGWRDGGVGTPYAGSRPAVALLLTIATGSLAWRRRRPLAVVLAVAASLSVQVLFVGPGLPLLAGLIPLVVAEYTAAAYAPRRPWVGLVAALCVLAALVERVPEERVAAEQLFGLIVMCSVWVIGQRAGKRWRAEQAAALLLLQVEQDQHAAAAEILRQERARLARELHDVIAHGVSVMGVQAAAARAVLHTDPAASTMALRAIEEQSRECIAELQRLLGIMRDGPHDMQVEAQPGLDHLDPLLTRVRTAGVAVDLRVHGTVRAIPAGVDLTAYRVVQEALTNVLKHAGPARAEVAVSYEAGGLDISVTDDGRPTAAGSNPGHGLVGMHERVLLYGGTLTAGAGQAGGFRVHVRLPVEATA